MHSDVIETKPGTAPPPGPTTRREHATTATASTDSLVHGYLGALLRSRDELLPVLTGVATAQAAADEILRSLRALSGAPWELRRNAPRRLGRLAAFLPSNNLLYSYILFGVIPSLYTDEVRLRPSARVASAALAVHEILAPHLTGRGGGRIVMAPATQREFLADCARSDAVVFTGRPDNAETVAAHLPDDTLLLTFGSGPNPVVVGPRADPDTVCRAVLDARLYNAGQDCLCTDIVFIHRSLTHEVVPRIADALAAVRVGDRRDPGVRVAPLVYPDAAEGAARFLARHREFTVRGGHADPDRGTVEPTLLHLPWRSDFHPPEFFSPVVLTMEYDDPRRLAGWLHSAEETARGMYVSVFGEPALAGATRLSTSVVCEERITFDAEDGNRPFGGYGPRAGGVRRHGRTTGRPLLLSAETSPGAGR
ncbi:aldehyde dehydrogenase family protein [Streptomyces sp. NBC_01216]|uniref:aldehyde dehydrogenase family protein n=1 Tax=unclassified Streptomyces TaxID=2593676 RepID=UPI002E15BFEB|nr:aldehyde dehydrogenase family protein [Streptomyces sp. NBC_01216]